ncbi:MAG TPA: DUF5719 family protein [Ilumatobacter sp.]|nr:DUF5719 family protein [Ilumatobacter sp.]
MKRRYLGLVVVVLGGVALIGSTRTTLPAETTTFQTQTPAWMPHASNADVITESWFCPGVPATGQDDVNGAIVIANRSESPLLGTAIIVNDRAQNARIDINVAGWSTTTIDLDATLPGAMVGAIVELEGGGGLVEQQALNADGDSQAACATDTSSEWYLADGFTVEGSRNQIVLMNPYEQTVVASLEFATGEITRAPGSYSGLTVPARSVRVIDLGAPGAGAQSEPRLAVQVKASQGRLVVGRSQTFLGGGRLGTQAALAAPALNNQWWFAGGRHDEGYDEEYVIYNPTDDDVEVDAVFLGIEGIATTDPILVPGGQVVAFDPDSVTDLPATRYAAVFATLTGPSVVVERVTTQNLDGTVATSVMLGAVARPDGYLAGTWHVPLSPGAPTAGALSIYNYDDAEGTISVLAVGPSGPVPIPGLADLPLPPPSSVLVVDLTDPAAVGRELIVQTNSRIFVERSFPTGRDDTRSLSWAIPEG